MNIKIFFLLFLLPLSLASQNNAAVELLERAVKSVEADAPVQFAFDYVVRDDAGVEQFADNGTLKLAGERYALSLTPMQLWCDGETQWSYLVGNKEIYIAAADSDEAQIYNPLHLMGLYKKGYTCTAEAGDEEVAEITLVATSPDASFDKVVISVSKKNNRPLAMTAFMAGEGSTSVSITGYKSKCVFDDGAFACPVENFPDVEIVDMR